MSVPIGGKPCHSVFSALIKFLLPTDHAASTAHSCQLKPFIGGRPPHRRGLFNQAFDWKGQCIYGPHVISYGVG